MREIKFRAWDYEMNEMIYPHEKYDLEHHVYIMHNNGINYLNYQNSAMSNELMQFTGLRDKNRKEIYEGDIVKHNKNLFQIIHSENQHVLVLRNIKQDTNWRDLNWCYNVRKYIEIIGNIHQDKHLLK